MNPTWKHVRHQLHTITIHQNPVDPLALLYRRLHCLYFNLFHFSLSNKKKKNKELSPFLLNYIFFLIN